MVIISQFSGQLILLFNKTLYLLFKTNRFFAEIYKMVVEYRLAFVKVVSKLNCLPLACKMLVHSEPLHVAIVP